MQERSLKTIGSTLSLRPNRYPGEFRHVDGNANVLSILYGTTPDEWRRTWRAQVGWTPEKEAIIDIAALSRSAAAANSQPSTRMIPNREVALTTIERPIDSETLLETVESYVSGSSSGSTIVYLDEIETMVADVGLETTVSILRGLDGMIREAGIRGLFCLDPDAVETDTIAVLSDAVERVHEEDRWVDDVAEAVETLRRDDPTNYGYARRHWGEARTGIERCDRNYPQARQIHDLLDDPETTPRTMGATLRAFVDLGVIDVWSETVGSTRYDLRAYNPELLASVGDALDASG